MTREDFIKGKPFVVPEWEYPMQYTEVLFGGEVRINCGKFPQTVEVEEITQEYFVMECWLNRNSDHKIHFKNIHPI